MGGIFKKGVHSAVMEPSSVTGSTIVPLFPLPLVVLPTEPQMLHIFEERYRQLVEHVLDQDAKPCCGDFGIIRYDEQQLSETGTLVRLSKVLHEHEDGRYEILTHGRRRFRLIRIVREHDYDSAEIEVLDDGCGGWCDTLASEAFQAHKQLSQLVTGTCPPDDEYCGKGCLSMFLGQSSGLDLAQRQALLELDDENDRLRLLLDHMQRMCQEIERVACLRQQIQDNWGLRSFWKDQCEGGEPDCGCE